MTGRSRSAVVGLERRERLVAVHARASRCPAASTSTGGVARVAQQVAAPRGRRPPRPPRGRSTVSSRTSSRRLKARVVDDEDAAAGVIASASRRSSARRAGRCAPRRRAQRLGSDRLRDVVVHAGREARLAVAFHRVRGHRHDPRSGVARPARRGSGGSPPARRARASGRPSGRRRRRVRSMRGDRLQAVAGDVGAIAHPLEQPERELLVHRVVLGQQDAQRMARAELAVDAGAGRSDRDGRWPARRGPWRACRAAPTA